MYRVPSLGRPVDIPLTSNNLSFGLAKEFQSRRNIGYAFLRIRFLAVLKGHHKESQCHFFVLLWAEGSQKGDGQLFAVGLA